MGNILAKLCYCGRPEEDHPLDQSFRNVEEVPIEVLDSTQNYEESIYDTVGSSKQNGFPEEPIYDTVSPPWQNGFPEEPIYDTVGPPVPNGIPEEPIYDTVGPPWQNGFPEEPIYDTVGSPWQNGFPEEPIYDTVGPPMPNGIPEEPIYDTVGPPWQNGVFEESEDSSGYMVMRPPLHHFFKNVVKLSKENKKESFRFRVSAQHYYISNEEDRSIVDTPVPIDLLLNSDKKTFLFHISVFNSHRERIEDVTLIGGVGPHFIMEYVIYWKDSREDSWRFNFSSENTQKLFEHYRISPVKNVNIWASIIHNKNNSEFKKFVLLSGNPDVIPTLPEFSRSAECVMHMTAYDIQLTKTLDVILVQGNNPFYESECYSQFKNSRVGSREFSNTMPTFANSS